eukprot:10514256-Alexandrium_andersonii.AAC.1
MTPGPGCDSAMGYSSSSAACHWGPSPASAHGSIASSDVWPQARLDHGAPRPERGLRPLIVLSPAHCGVARDDARPQA